jgi:hypothetical protein
MHKRYFVVLVIAAMLLAAMGCSKTEQEQTAQKSAPEDVTTLKIYPLDSTAGLITRSSDEITVKIDPDVSSDGNGSLMIEASDSAHVRLFDVGDLDVENARLTYRARIRTEGVEGRVYLEMLCHFPGMGDFFSRGLPAALSGTNNWVTVETPFFLKAGENPDDVKLSIVFDGTGTAWIDDIQLIQGPVQ